MALHMSGLVSRSGLNHPEKPHQPMPFVQVLKFNPNHASDGKFSSGKGGGGFKTRDISKDPKGTQYYDDRTLIPTGKKVAIPAKEGMGTLYGMNETLIPDRKGGYVNKETGAHYEIHDVVDNYVTRSLGVPNHPGSVDKSGKPKKRSTFS